MKKLFFLWILFFIVGMGASSSENFYFRKDKKIVLETVEGKYSLIKNDKIRSTDIAVDSERKNLIYGVFVLKDINSREASELKQAGRLFPAIREKSGITLYLTGDVFVKLPDTFTDSELKKWCLENNLKHKKRYKIPSGWHVVETLENPVEKARELVLSDLAEAAEPSFIIPVSHRAYVSDDTFFPRQWHLRNINGLSEGLSGNDHVHVAEAWELLLRVKGSLKTDVRVAVIDDGFDLAHEDLQGVFVDGKDFEDGDNNPSPGPNSVHGTPCAGLIAARMDNGKGVAGVCPACKLVPVKMLMSGYGLSLDQVAIESMAYAAEKNVDIISNSWGPADGGGQYDPGQPLLDLFQELKNNGRDGRGIIVHFASGNGNESLEMDGMAANENVFAIGAVNAVGRRSQYSDFGPSLDFMASSNDTEASEDGGWGGGAVIDGIWTTDNTSGGYNPGQMTGDDAGFYIGQFGGTSAAAPIAAGITALLLTANPELTWDDVYEIYRSTSDKVSQGNVGNQEQDYDSNGFSPHYGFGRINACKAVVKAFEMTDMEIPEDPCNPENRDIDDFEDGEDDEIVDDEISDEDDFVHHDEDPDLRIDSGDEMRSAGGNSCGCTLVY